MKVGYLRLDRHLWENAKWTKKEIKPIGYTSMHEMMESLQKQKLDAVVLAVESSRTGLINKAISYLKEAKEIQVIEERIVEQELLIWVPKIGIARYVCGDTRSLKEMGMWINKNHSKITLISSEDPGLIREYFEEGKIPKETIFIGDIPIALIKDYQQIENKQSVSKIRFLWLESKE